MPCFLGASRRNGAISRRAAHTLFPHKKYGFCGAEILYFDSGIKIIRQALGAKKMVSAEQSAKISNTYALANRMRYYCAAVLEIGLE